MDDRISYRIRQLGELFWRLSEQEKQVAIALYRLLARGEPVAADHLAARAGLGPPIVEELLDRWPGVFRDEQGRVVGFWGLTIHPMKHRLIVDDVTLHAWCAWDTLFIPLILGRPAEVRSQCPTTGRAISVRVLPEGVVPFPPSTVVSFVVPGGDTWTREILTRFCHWVHFFVDHEAGQGWLTDHEGVFVLSIHEAYQAAKHKVAYEYGGCPALLPELIT